MVDPEKFGEQIERLMNLRAAMELPLPDSMHVQQLKEALPEVIEQLKRTYLALTGENPWENHPADVWE